MYQLTEQDMHWVNSTLNLLDAFQIEEAIELVRRYAISEQGAALKFHLLGLIACKVENYAEALSFFKQASEIDNQKQVYFEACGLVAARLGMMSDSVYYLKMSATCPEPDQFHRNLLPEWFGQAGEELSQIEERPFFHKARESYQGQDFTQALSHIQQALNADPFNVDSWLLVYHTMRRLGRDIDALQAVQAALDSAVEDYEVSPCIRAEAGLIAAKIGNQNLANQLFQKALLLCDPLERSEIALKALCIIREYPEYAGEFSKWVEAYLLKIRHDEVISPLSMRLNLGIYSTDFGWGQGQDPYVHFLRELALSKKIPWLNIKLYSKSEFEDGQNRRLSSHVYGYRNCYDIDSKTLGKIMANDHLHILWDWEGLSEKGTVVPHNETSIPVRVISHWDRETFGFKMINGMAKFSLDAMPISFPSDIDWASFVSKPIRKTRQIAISTTIGQMNPELLKAFKALKEIDENFIIRLDTVRLGGVQAVDTMREKLAEFELESLVEFEQPIEDIKLYYEGFYSKSEICLILERYSGLQDAFQALSFGSVIIGLTHDQIENDVFEGFMHEIGLEAFCYSDHNALFNTLAAWLSEDDFRQARKETFSQISTKTSVENRLGRIESFRRFLLDRVSEIYGDAYVKRLLSQEGDGS